MHQLDDYDLFIFDCDGVVFDSNDLKIEAMKQALCKYLGAHEKINECLDYFKVNFGASRFNHVNFFVNEILALPDLKREEAYGQILDCYSAQCKELYLTAEITPGFLNFINTLPGKKYIASGSEQEELIDVFKSRGLDTLFEKVLGSPNKKVNLVSSIIEGRVCNAVMFGDAISDMDAAFDNSIDFIAYLPYSNVSDELVKEAKNRGFITMNSWSLDK